MTLSDWVEAATGRRPIKLSPLGGGCVADVFRIDMPGGERLVAKVCDEAGGLATEAWMLSYLAEHSRLPLPGVVHADDRLLLMTWIENSGSLDAGSQAHAAELLAELHGIAAPRFGLDRPTLIGGLHQPNPWTDGWIEFFRDQRLLYMGREAMRVGRLPPRLMDRLEKLCSRLDRWLVEPEAPSLIHGDMWTGNILVAEGRISGFIDPAIYYADAEIELAFSTLFGTFARAFFNRYAAIRPIRPGFFEERIELYNLYPLLVHVRLFGGAYVGSVERGLARFGA